MALRASIVVPTYRRPHLLERCLAALAAQDMAPTSYEIIVADDGDEAATRQAVQQMVARLGPHPALRYVPVRGRHGPAAARNRGWRAARGDIVAFTDDDCLPATDWLRRGLRAFRPKTAAVWGQIVVPLPAQPTDYERDAARLQSAGFVTANCFCRRRVLRQIGGLDENFTAAWREDSDLYFTLLERGFEVTRASRAVVVHPIRPARWGASLWQQRKILFDALLYKKHPVLYRRRIQATPPWRYYATLAALLTAGGGALAGSRYVAVGAAAVWLGLTAQFCWRRLRHCTWHPRHVVEMVVTSALIPPLAVFWRLAGAFRFRVGFL